MKEFSDLLKDVKAAEDKVKAVKGVAANKLHEMMLDESIPLFDRWNLFINNCELFPVYGDICWCDERIKEALRSHHDPERYRTYLFSYTFEECTLWNIRSYEEDTIQEIKKDFEALDEDLVRAVITCRHSGIYWDW